MTLLKNEKDLLPLSLDIAKIAIVGPHADDVEAGITTYTYPSALSVQLYVADTATGVTLPPQRLVGFARVDLEPRASERAFLSAATISS